MVRKEFSYKSFKRSFTLDEKIDAENIQAKYENGVLKLELPKKEIAKAGSREISIQ
ncbi:MAG: Hsp20/alpha crystallin family protein [Ferruginibacter sp.]